MRSNGKRDEQQMDSREFWIAVRRGLMMILNAIEKRYDLKVTHRGD